MRKRKIPWIALLLLLAGAVVSVLPMVYMITTSLRPNGALYEYPPRIFPRINQVTLENYSYVLFEENFYGNMLNSLVVAAASVALSAFAASAMAYCIARFRFPFRNTLFRLLIVTMVIPGMTLILPQFELAVRFGFINRLSGLVPFYVAWVLPFSTFMIKGFVETIPNELDEAVYMDGGSIFTTYFQVILPLASPSIAAVSVFNFLTAWEEYPWAQTVLNDAQKRTLPIAIAGFFGQRNFTQWGYVFAMSCVSLVPVVVLFLCLQKYFVTGLSSGAVKG